MSMPSLDTTTLCIEKLVDKFEYEFEQPLLEEMCSVGKIKSFNEGEIIMDTGDVLTHMPLVLSGSVKVMTEDSDGGELLLYYLEFGDTCAMTLSCCTKPSKSNVKAISESNAEIIFLPVQKMEEWMIKYHSWRSYVLESYNYRFKEMLESIDNLAFNNMEDRIFKYLREKVIVNKSPKLNITHAAIAAELNSSRVVISRLMKKLERDNKIIQNRNSVDVLDFH